MPDEKYNIIFTGKLAEGLEAGQVLNNLAALFKKSPDEIREKFKRGAVISRNLPKEKADKAIAALARAGAICIADAVVQAQEPKPEPLPEEPPGEKGVSKEAVSPPPSPQTSGSFKIIDIEETKPDLTLAPINCNRIAGDESGLTTNRMDRSFIPFDQVILAAVYTPEESAETFNLLLYSTGNKRPLLVDARQVSFGDFEEVAGSSLQESLRNFLKFLAQKSQDFLIDRSTASFCEGDKPLVCPKDPLPLVCSLYQAISTRTDKLGQPTPPVQHKPKPQVPTQPPPPDKPAADPSEATVEEVEVRSISPFEQFIDWSGRWQWPILVALLIGFCLPFLKRSILYDDFLFVWPWNQMGAGIDGPKAAAMATFSQGDLAWAYTLLPLLTAIGIGIGIPEKLHRLRGLFLFLLGGLPLLASLTYFHKEAETYGIIHLPMAWEGGALVFCVILAVIFIAATNHLYKLSGPNLILRVLNGLGGTVLLLATLLAMFAAPWNNWALYLLYLIFLAMAGLSIKGTISGDPDSDMTSYVSLLLRAILVWTPIATITSQSSYDDPFVTYVVESGGGVFTLFFASLKCYAIHYSMAIAMGLGLSGLLTARIFKTN